MTRSPILLLLPLSLGVAAFVTDWTPVKMAVPLSVAAIALLSGEVRRLSWRGRRGWRVWLVVAMLLSTAGDWYLSNSRRVPSFFAVGMGFYAAAMGAYLALELCRGGVSRRVSGLTILVFVSYVVVLLVPAADSPTMRWLLVVYGVLASLIFGGAWGVQDDQRWAMVTAVSLILLSDFLISQAVFLGNDNWDVLILPTYYAAHVLLARQAQRLPF